jgi:hypothetical protein
MMMVVVVFLRTVGLICSGHRAVVLDNLALRQQLAALTRTINAHSFARATDSFSILFVKRVAGLAPAPWSSSSQTLSSAGIVLRRRWATRSRHSDH